MRNIRHTEVNKGPASILLVAALLATAGAAPSIQYSQLWGSDDSNWNKAMLKDFSHVGYRIRRGLGWNP